MPLNILIVDDNQNMVSMLSMYFTQKGSKVTGVYNVPQALEAFAKDRFDAVLVDVCLKPFSGMVFLKSLKSRGNATPMIMMSGYAKPEQIEECLSLGAYDFLLKPFRLELLDEILQTIEDRHQRFAKMGVIQ